ncbi:MAG TPA: VOC family protein [Caulobacteraceae bacterium]|nr:VOC family protein [Caulobacteraceae bacterium]
MKVLIGALAALAATTVSAQTLPPMPASAAPTGMDGVALNVVDLEKERAFYEQAFGMKVAAGFPATGEVREWLLNWSGKGTDKPVLVLNKVAGPRQAGQDAFGRLIIATPNAAEIARRVVAAGGKVRGQVRENAINFGIDPEGNLIEIFQQSAAPALRGPPAK